MHKDAQFLTKGRPDPCYNHQHELRYSGNREARNVQACRAGAGESHFFGGARRVDHLTAERQRSRREAGRRGSRRAGASEGDSLHAAHHLIAVVSDGQRAGDLSDLMAKAAWPGVVGTPSQDGTAPR